SADLDIFALPTPQESGTNSRNGEHQSPVLRFESSPELEDEVEILKNSIYNAVANLTNNSDLASQVSPPPGDIPSPPTHSNDLGPSTSSSVEKLDTVRNMDEERIQQYRQTPNVLENGRIQCTLCSVILKTFDSYNIHRHTQHGLPTIENSSQQLPDDS
uniref:C2H2-type domain-containing protein n=1 Tax=Panagrolaimus sp. ES5 TaxID=591445 RepID=A0AC34FPK7_9BILA